MKVKCEYCGYVWDTKAKTLYVTCPNCQKKTRVIPLNKTKKDK